jgi:Na+-driven multidrug efflux pump
MVGTISPAAIAAVGAGGTLYWNLLVLGHGPSLSAGYLCAQSYGGGRIEDFLERAVIGFLFSAVAGLLLALLHLTPTLQILTLEVVLSMGVGH